MKRTQRKDAFRNIRKKLISFLSLILIVFLGVMGFFYIHNMGRDLKATTGSFYRNQNFKDVIMASSLGVGDTEVERIKALSGVADAEGVTLLSAQIQNSSKAHSITLLTKTERISKPELLEGSLPTGTDTVALGWETQKNLKANIGDVVQLRVTDAAMPDCLIEKEFKVVGIVNQPEYLRKSRTLFAMVDPEAMDNSKTYDSFTRVYVKAALPENTDYYSQEYLDAVAKLSESLQQLSETLGQTRINSIKNLAIQRSRILNIEILEPVKDALLSLDADQLIQKLTDGKPENLVPVVRDFIDKAQSDWSVYFALLTASFSDEMWAQINQISGLDKEQIQAYCSDLIMELSDKLEQNMGMVEKLSRGTHWVVLDNRSDEGYVDMRTNIASCRNISVIYGSLFAVVSMLVCFSTLTIIISEQKKMIGATKAFGFFSREVFGKYLIFGELAAVIGLVLGILLGDLLTDVITKSFLRTYILNSLVQVRSWQLVLVVLAGLVLMIGLACFIACKHILRSPAAALINGTDQLAKKKGIGKLREKGEKKGSLYSRLILRNMVSELPRVIISVIIIAGSLMIMGVGFSLKFSTDEMIERQRDEINLFVYKISFDAQKTGAESLAATKKKLEEAGFSLTEALSEVHIFESSQGQEAVNLLAVKADEFGSYMSVRDPKTRAPLGIPEEGVLIQLKMSEVYGIQRGESITLRDNELAAHEAAVIGVFDNYQGRLMLISMTGYQKLFGTEARPNALYLLKTRQDADTAVLKALPKGMIVETADAFVSRYSTLMSLYDLIVLGMAGMSVLLSFLILTNLTNIFVSRKKKELIIMRVNGFSVKEDVAYLARETVLTILLGLILGVVAGIFVTKFVIYSMEQPDVQLVRTPITKAWILAAALELSFALIINFLAFRKVKDYKLSEIAEA